MGIGALNPQFNPNILVPPAGLQKIYGGTERRDYVTAQDMLQNRFSDSGQSELLSPELSLPALQSLILANILDGSVSTEEVQTRAVTDVLNRIRRKCYTYPWLGGLALCEKRSDEPTITHDDVLNIARQGIFKDYHLPLGLTYKEGSVLEIYASQNLSFMSLIERTFPEDGLAVSTKPTAGLSGPQQQFDQIHAPETAHAPLTEKQRKARRVHNMVKRAGTAIAHFSHGDV